MKKNDTINIRVEDIIKEFIKKMSVEWEECEAEITRIFLQNGIVWFISQRTSYEQMQRDFDLFRSQLKWELKSNGN